MRRSRSAWRRVALLLVILTLLSACHQSVGAAAEQSGWNGSVTVRVVNHSWMDVTVYLQQGTRRERIGTATATSTVEFHVPMHRFSAGADYRLYGDPLGSRQGVRSEALHAQDGDVVTWTLEDDLARSSIDVR